MAAVPLPVPAVGEQPLTAAVAALPMAEAAVAVLTGIIKISAIRKGPLHSNEAGLLLS
jgi:hypothetical protein